MILPPKNGGFQGLVAQFFILKEISVKEIDCIDMTKKITTLF
jgi:hypothetical protein